MIFKGINHTNLHFDLEYRDYYELTGYIYQSEITSLHLDLSYLNMLFSTSISISEVQQLIDWFEELLLNEYIQTKLLILDNRFSLESLKSDSKLKTVRIIYDTTIPIRGMGGYYISPDAKKEDFLEKLSIECEMDNLEIERISKKLTAELQIELQIGSQVESRKPKKGI